MARIYLKTSQTHGKLEDQTKDVLHIEGPNLQGKYAITYSSNTSRKLTFNNENVAIVSEREITIKNDYIYRVDDRSFVNPQRITVLESDNPAFIKTVEVYAEDGELCTFIGSDVAQIGPKLSDSLYQYLSDVADAIKQKDVEDELREYLPKQFKRLANESIDDSAAGFMINPAMQYVAQVESQPIIYPFGSNLSQMTAVETALKHRFSLIEGPPGTGKTQTILNIIANLLLRNKTVLLASPNNEATKNVSDKLHNEGFGFLVAELGKRDNIERFISAQDAMKRYPSDLLSWELSPEDKTSLEESILRSKALLQNIYEKEQKIAIEEDYIRRLEIEFDYFRKGYNIESIFCRKRATEEHLRSALDVVRKISEAERSLPLSKRIQYVFLWGIGHWHDFDFISVDTEIHIDKAIYERGIMTHRSLVDSASEWLVNNNSVSVREDIVKKSRALFLSALFDRYATKAKSLRQCFEDPWKEPVDFRFEYPIITSTTNAARNQMGLGATPFDYIIIDESSQADLVTGFLALTAAENAVVVGDTNQLPCVISEEEKRRAIPIFDAFGLPKYYEYTEFSLLACLDACRQSHESGFPSTLLREHYRCLPEIIGFNNQKFYNNELIIMTSTGDVPKSSILSHDISVEGNHDRTNDYNRVQAEMFTQEVYPFFLERFQDKDIGVATPYRKQADRMKESLPADVDVDTVHKFQGREKSAIAFITKSNDDNDFIDNENLVNVAVSRAKQAFCLIAAPKVVLNTKNISDLLRYIEYNDGTIIITHVYPAFPFLYKERKAERKGYLLLRGSEKDAEYAETQTEGYIIQVLTEFNATSQVDFVRNYALKLIFPETHLFTEEEERFINNSAHADFVFFRTIDRSVILTLEVNGSQHDTDPKQVHRDSLKASILRKTNIPQAVIRTNEARNRAIDIIRESLKKALIGEADPDSFTINQETIYVAVDSEETPWERL